MTRTRSTFRLATIAIVAAALAGFALAQGADAGDTSGAANLALATIVAGAVAWLRSTPIGKRIDGPVAVPAFALVVGAVVGLGAELLGLLGWSPFADVLGRWVGAAAAGVVLGLEAVTGVSLGKYLGPLFVKGADGRQTFDSSAALGIAQGLVPGLLPGGATGAPQTAVAFVLDAAKAVLGREPLGGALTALYPLIVRYAQDPALLTDDRRAAIQAQVIDVLRKAGLAGVDLGQDPEAPA